MTFYENDKRMWLQEITNFGIFFVIMGLFFYVLTTAVEAFDVRALSLCGCAGFWLLFCVCSAHEIRMLKHWKVKEVSMFGTGDILLLWSLGLFFYVCDLKLGIPIELLYTIACILLAAMCWSRWGLPWR